MTSLSEQIEHDPRLYRDDTIHERWQVLQDAYQVRFNLLMVELGIYQRRDLDATGRWLH